MVAGIAMETSVATEWRSRARADEGFAAIVRAHQKMVYSLCWHFFRNRALAEETAQEVFLQLFRSLDTIDSEAHLEPWLRRTATNRCIDQYRKKGYQSEIAMEVLPERGGDSGANDALLAGQLRKLVATLPEAQRMVMVLKYQEDLDAAEIASMMDLPVQTVWSHLRRGVEFLKQKVTRLHDQGARRA